MPARPPPPALQATTLWEFPSQNYGPAPGAGPGRAVQGRMAYPGATPAGVVWNLLARYTRPGDLVVDPMAGSGTTLDVARDLGRRALGYDLQITRPDIFRADARRLPLEDAKADFVFADPPYADHLAWSGDPRCLGRYDAADPAFLRAMEAVMDEWVRVLRPDRHAALLVGDSFAKGRGFVPLGLELGQRLARRLVLVDMVAVARRGRALAREDYRRAAGEGNFFLRGHTHLFIAHKPPAEGRAPRPLAPILTGAAKKPR